MDIKQVQQFLAVAEAGSFSGAAENLYLSQSALSKQVIRLEQELEVQLFDRSHREDRLTPAGEVFRKHARELYRGYQTLLAELESHRSPPSSLAIAAIPVIAQYGITAHIARFRNQHPQIHLTLDERLMSTILPALEARQYDLAFIRDNYIEPERFDCTEIMRDQLVAVLVDTHPLAGRSSVALEELAHEHFIVYDSGTIIHRLSIQACREAGFEPQVFYGSLRVDSIISLVASGIGVGLLMEKVFQYHEHPGVVGRPLSKSVESSIVLASVRDVPLRDPARSFIEMVQQSYSEPLLPAD